MSTQIGTQEHPESMTKSELTERDLLRAAKHLFREQGYHETSVADIVNLAGRAHGTFYRYFDNKQDIFGRLLLDLTASLNVQSREIWRTDSPALSVWQTVLVWLNEYSRHRDLWELLDQMATVDDYFFRLRADFRQAFVYKIRRGIEATNATISHSLDMEILANALASMVQDLARVAHDSDRDWSTEELAYNITILWSRALGYSDVDLAGVRASNAASPSHNSATYEDQVFPNV